MNNSSSRSNNSLFDNSLKMVANVVKLTSFSIAKMSFGTIRPPPPPATRNGVSLELAAVSQFPGNSSRRSQVPQSSSRPVSYLIEPIHEGDEAPSYAIREEMSSVDGKASDYIKKVHEKNRHHSNETSTLSACILPPPPLVPMHPSSSSV